jgi:hypothetical protein
MAGTDLFDARGMTAQPAGERSRRPPLRQGDRGEAVFRPDQAIMRQHGRNPHGDRGDSGRTSCSMLKGGRREKARLSQGGPASALSRLPRTNPRSFPVDIGVGRPRTLKPNRGQTSLGNRPDGNTPASAAPLDDERRGSNGCRRGLSFAADRTRQHDRASQTDGP